MLTEPSEKVSLADADGLLDGLTPRQREIARLISDGSSNKEIAARLNVAESTVKAHLTAIFRKLKVSDRLQLALFVWGVQPGLLVPAVANGNGY